MRFNTLFSSQASPPLRTFRQSASLLLSPVALALLASIACDDETEDQQPTHHGSSEGGAPNETSDGGAAGSSHSVSEWYSREEPLYGETGDPPDQLRLVFRDIVLDGIPTLSDLRVLPHDLNHEGSTPPPLQFLALSQTENTITLVQLSDAATSLHGTWSLDDEDYIAEACGPTSLVLDPDFESNRYIYVAKCPDVKTTHIVRYEFDVADGVSNQRRFFLSPRTTPTTVGTASVPWASKKTG